LERPIGRKAEKEKQKTKEKTNLSVIVILNDMNEDKKKKLKILEEASKQDIEMFFLRKRNCALQKERFR
jgi:hypothetical protein